MSGSDNLITDRGLAAVVGAQPKSAEFAGLALSNPGSEAESSEQTKQDKRDRMYMDITERIAKESVSRRAQVGAIIVKNDNMVSYGWNGMPSGMPNDCEYEVSPGLLKTRDEVIHAEANAFLKLVREGGPGTQGATLYCTYSPCPRCAGEIRSARIARLVYKHEYRDTYGREMLSKLGVVVERIEDEGQSPEAKEDQ